MSVFGVPVLAPPCAGGGAKTGTPNTLMLCSLSADGILERGRHRTGAEAPTRLSLDGGGTSVLAVLQSRVVLYRGARAAAAIRTARAALFPDCAARSPQPRRAHLRACDRSGSALWERSPVTGRALHPCGNGRLWSGRALHRLWGTSH
eukprot:3553151-Prymnesium_polylepis.1